MKKSVLIFPFFLFLAVPLACAWWGKGKIVTPEGRMEKTKWSEEESLKDPVKKDLWKTGEASYHIIRLMGAEKPHVHDTHDILILVMRGIGVMHYPAQDISIGKGDVIQSFLDILKKEKIHFCVIGGLAVNAYAEPVVSLDLDMVIVAEKLKALISQLKGKFKVERFANSINLYSKGSDLRIQIQTDPRYQAFIKSAKVKNVLGYKLPVAAIEDVLQGKIWAAIDETRRPSKRQPRRWRGRQDLADILRLVEGKQSLKTLLPESLRKQLTLSH